MKYFIDCNSIIHPVGTGSDPEWIVVNEELATVYTIDYDGGVTGEYTLWNSLLELAKCLELGDTK